MTVAAGDATSIVAPEATGTYRVHVVDGAGEPVSESASPLSRVTAP